MFGVEGIPVQREFSLDFNLINFTYSISPLFIRIYRILVLTILNEEGYLTFKSIFDKVLNLFKFDCEITLESVPGTNQY